MLRLRVKEIAESQGLNRNQLQLRSGVTLPVLTRYWTNNTESVTLRFLDKIALALGVKGTDLLEDVEESESVIRYE
jgi:transcriptional regulator with XRE-family HTH domain